MQQIISKAKTFAVGSRLALLIGFLLIGAGYVQAQFVSPAGPPPTCTAGIPGCEIPLNTGASPQTKTGSITVQNPGDPNVGTRLSTDGRIHASSTIWSYSGIFGADAPTLLANTAKIVPIGTATVNSVITKGAAFEIQTAADGGVGGNKAEGLLPPRVNNDTVRNAITTALTGTCDSGQKKNANGLIVYNTSSSKLQQWKCTSGANGTWEDIGSGGGVTETPYNGPWFRAGWANSTFIQVSALPLPYKILFDQQISDVDPGSADNSFKEAPGSTQGEFQPTVSGVYVLSASVLSQIQSGGTNYAQISIMRRRAGVTTRIANSIPPSPQSGYTTGVMDVSIVTNVLAGDAFYVAVTEANGAYIVGTYNYGSGSVAQSVFSGYRISSGAAGPQGPAGPAGSADFTAFPVGSAMMWFGSDASIPTKWALCSGQFTDVGNAPDLRGRFPIGTGTYATWNGSKTVALNEQLGSSYIYNKYLNSAVSNGGGGARAHSFEGHGTDGQTSAWGYQGAGTSEGVTYATIVPQSTGIKFICKITS